MRFRWRGGVGLGGVPASLAADGIRFLPDDAQIACRAILPQCFTQQGCIASVKTIQPWPKRIGGLAASRRWLQGRG